MFFFKDSAITPNSTYSSNVIVLENAAPSDENQVEILISPEKIATTPPVPRSMGAEGQQKVEQPIPITESSKEGDAPPNKESKGEPVNVANSSDKGGGKGHWCMICTILEYILFIVYCVFDP